MERLTVVATGQAPERELAVIARPGAGPPVVWLGGFRSDMRATKAEALDAWAAQAGRGFVRFDYSGHGESSGAFDQATIGQWLEDAIAVLEAFVDEPPVLVGSSMGGWIALLAATRLRQAKSAHPPIGLVLIAPAVDFTERLMWDNFSPEIRATIMRDGVWQRSSAYSPEPYPITRRLIEEGRRHLILESPIVAGCPVHILQGMKDPDVPWRHALEIVEHMPGDSVSLTLIKDGDHRLSRPEDIDRLIAAVAAIVPAR